jgi:hypothetical protein
MVRRGNVRSRRGRIPWPPVGWQVSSASPRPNCFELSGDDALPRRRGSPRELVASRGRIHSPRARSLGSTNIAISHEVASGSESDHPPESLRTAPLSLKSPRGSTGPPVTRGLTIGLVAARRAETRWSRSPGSLAIMTEVEWTARTDPTSPREFPRPRKVTELPTSPPRGTPTPDAKREALPKHVEQSHRTWPKGSRISIPRCRSSRDGPRGRRCWSRGMVIVSSLVGQNGSPGVPACVVPPGVSRWSSRE